MAWHNNLGTLGEEAACRYLGHKGYRLIDRNWRNKHLEIDIVAEWYGEIVFVEVKTRSETDFDRPSDTVGQDKIERLLRAGNAYMTYNRLNQPFRFDIITVVGTQPPFEFHHVERAFDAAAVRSNKSYLYT